MATATHSPVDALAVTPVAEPETEQPLIRLDLYPSAVRMTRYAGPAETSFLVSPLDLAAAWTQMPVASGFLPPNTLFWQRHEGAELLAVFVPGRQWLVQGAGGPLRLPLPPLVFIGQERSYAVFAVKRRPTGPAADLFHAPLPNVWPSGQICGGSAPFPHCSAATIGAALALFLEGSRFNRHLIQGKSRAFPADVYQLWQAVAGKRRFPLIQLVPTHRQLAHIMR
jgi:PRTRC genetic system protein B